MEPNFETLKQHFINELKLMQDHAEDLAEWDAIQEQIDTLHSVEELVTNDS
jgi:hypothetical protein